MLTFSFALSRNGELAALGVVNDRELGKVTDEIEDIDDCFAVIDFLGEADSEAKAHHALLFRSFVVKANHRTTPSNSLVSVLIDMNTDKVVDIKAESVCLLVNGLWLVGGEMQFRAGDLHRLPRAIQMPTLGRWSVLLVFVHAVAIAAASVAEQIWHISRLLQLTCAIDAKVAVDNFDSDLPLALQGGNGVGSACQLGY